MEVLGATYLVQYDVSGAQILRPCRRHGAELAGLDLALHRVTARPEAEVARGATREPLVAGRDLRDGCLVGLWKRLLGRQQDASPIVADGTAVVLRRRELAETLQRPAVPAPRDATAGPCDRCGKPLAEMLITTGGPLGDAELWRDCPVAVEGWVCMPCGVFRYPRPTTPERITEIGEEGAAHGRAGRIAEAELCFVRITWDWPGFVPGHLNLAEATRERLHADGQRTKERGRSPADEALRRRLVDRMVAEYEAAIGGYVEDPIPSLASGVARGYLVLAEVAIERRAFERAAHMAEACAALEGASEADTVRALELLQYVEERHDLFEEAAEALQPYIHLTGRPGKPIETGSERKRLSDAVDKLEKHVALAPSSMRGAWLLAKGKMTLGAPNALDVWRRAHAAFPHDDAIARDFSQDLLRCDLVAEAHRVNLAIVEAHPADATLWCNLAVTALLSGDLDAAEQHVGRSLALDPDDSVARIVQQRLASYRAGARVPRTLHELEGR